LEGIAWHEWSIDLLWWGEGSGEPFGTARCWASTGNIEELASGSLRVRVRVYAGVDVLTGRDLYLKETIPAGPDARACAQRRLDELVEQVLAGRHPKTNVPLRLLIEQHLQVADVERRTKEGLAASSTTAYPWSSSNRRMAVFLLPGGLPCGGRWLTMSSVELENDRPS
jgi:hypothetical protein